MIAKQFMNLVNYLIQGDIDKALNIYNNYIGTKFIHLFLLYYIISKEDTFRQIYNLIIYEKPKDLKPIFTLASNKLKHKNFSIIYELTDQFLNQYSFKTPNYTKLQDEYNLVKSKDPFIELRDIYFLNLLNIDAQTYIYNLDKLHNSDNIIKFNMGYISL